jgi:hypothetical protein
VIGVTTTGLKNEQTHAYGTHRGEALFSGGPRGHCHLVCAYLTRRFFDARSARRTFNSPFDRYSPISEAGKLMKGTPHFLASALIIRVFRD